MEHGPEPTLAVQAFPVGALHPYHRNPRRGVVPAIADSLRVRGQYRPIVVNVGTHTGRPLEVLAGNHTLQAAASIGWERIEATTVDVDDEHAAQIVLADNRLADLGTYDDAELLGVLQSIEDLSGTGYSDVDVAALLRELEEPVALTDPDAVPNVPETPVSVVGDVWELGPHRLVVGDATDAAAVRLAFDGLVDCVWTDPPYGVNYVGKTADALTIQNDGEADAKQVTLGALRTAVAVSKPGAPVYIAHSDVVRQSFQEAMADAGMRYRQTLIWVKNSFVLSRADYHYRHEPILEGEVGTGEKEWQPVAYGFAEGGEGRLGRGGGNWFGDNRSTTVFEVKRPTTNAQHPTMKPVELIERMLRNSCPPGGIVLDMFGGSGSTLIAAHRLGQRAVLVELDPHYADVICRRFEEHTGVTPKRAGESVSFTS